MNPNDHDARVGGGTASPYSTGGGGIVFEHTFGATLLAALLLGDPVPGLGDEQTVSSVTFQASRFSPVDDVVIVGEPRGEAGARQGRQLSVGVRRNPRIAPSDQSFVALLGSYLRMAQDEWERVKAGYLRLGLVVATPHSGVRELAALAEIARNQPSDREFRSFVATPGVTRADVRRRLMWLGRAVDQAAQDAGIEPPEGGISELTWRLLVGLYPLQTRLEGAEAADRTAVVARLRTLVGEASEADALFSQLCHLAGRYGPAGATVDEAVLRRDLSGVARLDRSPSHQHAWDILAELHSRLRGRIRQELSAGGQQLRLERRVVRDELIEAMKGAGSSGEPLVVTGDPDVGKSAITLAASDVLVSQGQEIVAMNLRDLPPAVLEANELLGASLRVVFGSMGVSPVRLLVIDGAEAALEDRLEVLVELGAATRRAGVGLVAVTRSDARGQVVEALTPRSPDSEAPKEFNIDGLTSDEVKEVVAHFVLLRRIANEPRSAWLLERPGLVDLLLRADAITALPDGALSEADVFAVVWSKLVRRSERNERGRGSPDGREDSLVNLALRHLVADANSYLATDPAALPSLRSDGLLLAPGPTASWISGDQFASDLIRDFAIARLLLRGGWGLLKDAGAPRWTVRAVRLACQATLARSRADVESARTSLQEVFDALAAEHGERWADLPLEALVTLGFSHDALERAWADIVGKDGAGLKRLCRLILQRYSDGLAVDDPNLVEPVVQLLFDHASDLMALPRDVHESVDDIEIRWLRGLALRGATDAPSVLRGQLRDRLLAGDISRHSEREQECVALLGPDLNAAAEQHLRALAAEAPGFLAPCIEAIAVGVSMASHRPGLLLELAEAYYIDKRDGWDHGYSLYDDGIRHHHRSAGLWAPLACWSYGPFAGLLLRVPWPTLAFVNRMLDCAVRARIQQLRGLESRSAYQMQELTADQDMPGLELDLPGLGIRKFVGDSHAWAWYRGSTVGPYPCMSALLAVERFADQVHDLGVDLRVLTDRLLKDCHNLAMPGLVVGFLVRHLEQVTDELDPWLAEPTIWELEFGRSSGEGRLHVQGPDPDDLHGRAHRRMSLRDVAIEITLRAVAADDEACITRLRSVADKLVDRASKLYGPDPSTPGFEERLSTVRNWSSFLRAESYEIVNLPDGRVRFQYTPPEVSREFVAQQVDLDRGMQVIGFLNYATHPGREPADVSSLNDHLKMARDLSEQPPEQAQEFTNDAFPAVAATAIIAFAQGRFHPDRADLEWAAGIVVQAAMKTADSDSMDHSFYDLGGDRSAAFAIPCLLLPPFNEDDPSWFDDEDLELIHTALFRLFTSGSDEVRRRVAKGLNRVWDAPCTPSGGAGSQCRHVTAFEAVEASARDCRIGRFDNKAQRRQISRIEGALADVIDGINSEDLLIGRLIAPIIAASTCASSACCVSPQAANLRGALLRTHARGAVHWVSKNFQLDVNPEVQEAVAECCLGLAREGQFETLLPYVETLMEEPTALHHLLDEMARAATYDQAWRRTLREAWPIIMAHALTVLEDGRGFLGEKRRYGHRDPDQAIASLLARPQIRMNEKDVQATLQHVKEDWLDWDAMEPLIARWLPFAAGIPECVDSMVGFVHTMSPLEQASRGLDLVLQVVDGQFDSVASRTWLLGEWLEELKSTRMLQRDTLSKFQLLVDGLAAHGDWRAVRLQKSLE